MNAYTIYKLTKFFLKPILKLFFPFEFKGLENFFGLDKKLIICPNHLSNIDALFLIFATNRQIHFLVKSELFKHKLIKKFFEKIEMIPINRGKNDKVAIESAKNVLKNEKILGIFIEGKRSKTGEFLKPRSGAAVFAYSCKSSILPICITGGGKNNKVKIFKKTIIAINKPITFDELNAIQTKCQLTNDVDFIGIESKIFHLKTIKIATNLIMEKITKLR